MLNDVLLSQAITSLQQRAEKRRDERKTVETFVDAGILSQILSRNDQILYGRRGTGKTHVFQVTANKFHEDPTNAVVLIDGRTLGSTSQFTDSTIPLQQRCISLFRDVLIEISNGILDHIVNEPSSESEQALSILAELNTIALEPVRKISEEYISDREKGLTQEGNQIDGVISTRDLTLSAKFDKASSSETEKKVSYRVGLEDKVVFPHLQSLFSSLLTKAKAGLVILFDEWSSIPLDIQPYLAEFIKRSLLPNPNIVLKIATLEYRSQFFAQIDDNTRIGFELGSDISATIDLDDFYVYDRNPDGITAIMSDIVFKHIVSELPKGHLETKYGVTSSNQLVSQLFTQRPTFQELVRASEGVIRDLLNVFSIAYFDSKRFGKSKIELSAIEQAASQWFQTDKFQNLDSTLMTKLTRIVYSTIGERRARSFMIDIDLEKHPIIQRLSDYRILHLIKRGYADKDNPGRRYSIYTLDYGTYVDFKRTLKQPELDFVEFRNERELEDRIVPFDDKRSIRRIILDKKILE
ncbi:hypothetical protein ACFLVF_01145 [Chloroflexota bacterium]